MFKTFLLLFLISGLWFVLTFSASRITPPGLIKLAQRSPGSNLAVQSESDRATYFKTGIDFYGYRYLSGVICDYADVYLFSCNGK